MGKSNNLGKKIIVGGLILIAILGGFFYFRHLESERHKFKVVFLNVGQGDAALIQFENGEKMLVDCGPNREILSALGRNLAFYDRTIDYLLISHPDLDHYGGCPDVLKNYKIKKIFSNGRVKDDQYFQEWQTRSRAVDQETVGVSSTLKIASSFFKFFSPDQDLKFSSEISENDRSVVFQLDHQGKKFFFTGDMEAPLEKLLVEKYCGKIINDCILRSDVLKAGHHGSDGASSEYFLRAVRPHEAIISVGKNKFGHPSLRALRHLERTGAEIMRTDWTGDIIFR